MGYLAEMDAVELIAASDVVRESAEGRCEEYGMAAVEDQSARAFVECLQAFDGR